MRPLSQSDGHDAQRLIDKLVPGEAAVIYDVIAGREDAVGQPVVTHELPYVFGAVQLRASGRQRHEGDVGGDDEFCRAMPSGLIEQQISMCTRCDVEDDLLEMQADGLAVAAGHDDPSSLTLGRADFAKDPSRGAVPVLWSRRPGSPLGPAAGELGLLADACLILPPQLYGHASGEGPRDLCQTGGEAFLKSVMSSDFWP